MICYGGTHTFLQLFFSSSTFNTEAILLTDLLCVCKYNILGKLEVGGMVRVEVYVWVNARKKIYYVRKTEMRIEEILRE